MPSASNRPVATLFSPSQERRRLLFLLLGAALLFGAGIGRRALWNPNEPVYGEGVREMIARGDYFLPYVNGTIYSDKPILYFWAMLAACKLGGGLSEAALRIPSVAGGVLSVLLVYLFGRRIFGIRAGFLAAACLATSVMFWWHSQYVQMDQMLSFLMAGSLVLFFCAKETAGPGALLMVLSGVLMGLAFLTKGPVGVVVPAAAMGVYLLAVKEWRWIFRREIAWMAAACAVVAAPWYVSLAFTGHQAVLADFFIRHNLDRATDPFNHAQPFWYYLPRLFSDLFPWSLLLPAAFAAPVRNELERRGRLFATVWFAAVFVLFSAAGSKRGVYLLPLYPAAALLTGKLLDEVLSGGAPPAFRRWTRVVMGFLGIFLCAAFVAAAGLALWPAPNGVRRAEVVALLPLGLGALAGGAAILLSLRRWRLLTAVAALILCMSGIYLYADLVALKLADRYKSPVAFCRKVAAAVGPEDEIRSHGLWRWDSSYLFYTGRLMPQIHSREETEEYLSQGRKVYLVVESSDMDRFLAGLKAPAQVLARQQIGHKTTALLVNRREGS
jgi:4-amino-4-deoxy-L-arabinose transferase-like glycosyltransferase